MILQPDQAAIERATSLLRSGKPVGLPTETVYGLAGDAANEDAILAIYRTKARPSFDPLIVHVQLGIRSVKDLAHLNLIDDSLIDPPRATKIDALIEKFWPGPLTLILPKHQSVSDLVTSGLKMVGIRMPDHPVAQKVLASFGTPLAAPSANRFGRISPTSAADVNAELGPLIDLILDGGECERGVESTVIGLGEQTGFNILRPGSLTQESIEQVLGEKLCTPSAESSAASPGTLASHYAPEKKFLLLPKSVCLMTIEDWDALGVPSGFCVSLLIPCGKVDEENYSNLPYPLVASRSLSDSGDDREASRNLFRTIRELDAHDSQVILCEPVTRDGGLWIAIKDRLNRATSRI